MFGKILPLVEERKALRPARRTDSKGIVLVRCNAETLIGKQTLQKSEWDTSLRK